MSSMNQNSQEAFLLLTLPNATLTTSNVTERGSLALECVNVNVPGQDQDVYLVLRLNTFETPIDPSRPVEYSLSDAGTRRYTFCGWDGSEIVVTFPAAADRAKSDDEHETFDNIIAEYTELRGVPHVESSSEGRSFAGGKEDLRGHFVFVNEDNGEVVGTVDRNELAITEDPALHDTGRENDAVVVEVPEKQADGSRAREVFVRSIPPSEQDWITKGATLVSWAISSGTNLLVSSIGAASSYYIANSKPHDPSTSASSSSAPAKPPSRALVFMTSERTRKGLTGIHAVSGQAVSVSTKTMAAVDSMIKRAVGGKAKAGTTSSQKPPLPRRSVTPTPTLPPPPYTEKPRLPPRAGSTLAPPTAPPLPPRSRSTTPEPGPSQKMGTRERLILSADLIWTTLDDSTKQLLDVGSQKIGDAIGHKYGPHAAANTNLMTGTARNIVLVYVDMRGIGRRALLKRAGKEFVKARVAGRKGDATEGSVYGKQ
ncbi:hypothetical protein PLICRDRAFT_604154 [Plicaturopsis crispa FD-325 SS-3]|nr:hypothetical protein PLICRDRAFT_604154 [Plicaturopsis crispa FD-325 SS-3]